MADIFHNLIIKCSPNKVFEGLTSSAGLDSWWTLSSEVQPEAGGIYKLYFGPGYQWKAIVTRFHAGNEFELKMTESDRDWQGSKVGFILHEKNDSTEVNFYHEGWPENNQHFKISCYCWAMYLRILKRFLEFGELVPYENRLNV